MVFSFSVQCVKLHLKYTIAPSAIYGPGSAHTHAHKERTTSELQRTMQPALVRVPIYIRFLFPGETGALALGSWPMVPTGATQSASPPILEHWASADCAHCLI